MVFTATFEATELGPVEYSAFGLVFGGSIYFPMRANVVQRSLEITPAALQITGAYVGEPVQRTITVKNVSSAALVVRPPFAVTGGLFGLSSDVPSAFTLPPGESRSVAFTITPSQVGPAYDAVRFASASGTKLGDVDVMVTATLPPKISATPGTVQFPATAVGGQSTQDVTVKNIWSRPVTVQQVSISAAAGLNGAGEFTASLPSGTIAPDASISIPVVFKPSAYTARGAVLRIAPAGGEPVDVQLRGHGAREPSNLTLSQRTLSTPGAVPTEVATGDVNGDGKVDVAAAFAASGRIAVALGNGDGTFGAFTTVATDGAQSEMGLATADINGDGRDDVAVGDSTGAAVYRWTATGFVLITRASTARATDLRVADLDEDGFQDLAVIDAVGRRISFFLGTGSTFTAAGDRALNGTPREFQIVDFEGGIRPDFVLSNTAGAVAPFSTEILSQATAGFAPSRMLPLTVTTPTLPAAIAVGHFDGSGQLDLTTGDRVLLYPADPSGATTGPVTVESGAGGEAIAVADFDGDGRDDQALATSATGRVAVQRSLGGGLFAEPDVFTVPVVSGSQPADIASADLNGDGRPDVIASNGGAGLSVLLNGASFTAASGVGRALIDQFRPGVSPIVQLHNPSRSAYLRLGGWQLRYSNGDRYTFPQDFQLPARASRFVGVFGIDFDHLFGPDGLTTSLFAAQQSAAVLGLVRGAQGVALYDPAGRLVDAVGLSTAPAGYREGAGLTGLDLGHLGVFARRDRAGALLDSAENAADFEPLNPEAVSDDGTILGVPGWRVASDPTNRNDILQSSLIDPSKPASAAPNRERVGDQLIIRRRITNCSGGLSTGVCVNADRSAPAVRVTRLSTRITELSTIGNSSDAILTLDTRAVSGGVPETQLADSTFVSALATGTERGTGIGSALNVLSSKDSSTTLDVAPGESVTVTFRFNILRAGRFTFGYATDDDLVPAAAPTQTPVVGVPADVPTDTPAESPSAPLVIPPASAAAPEAIAGQVAAPVNPAAAQAALTTAKPIVTGKPTAKPKAKCLTKAQYKRLKPKQRRKAKLCAPKRSTSSIKKGAR